MRHLLALLLGRGPRRVVCELRGHDPPDGFDETFGGLPARTCRRCGEVETRSG